MSNDQDLIFHFHATHYRISYEMIQESNGLITRLEEEAEATSIAKNGATHDMNGENYEEEDAASGDESDDVSCTPSVSLASTNLSRM